jgi:hypothetical protein
VTIDLKGDSGVSKLKQMLRDADVFLTNIRPSGLMRLGLDYESLRSEFPSLIMAQLTAWGMVSQNGLLLSRRGRSLPTNDSGFDTHRDSISSRFDCRTARAAGWLATTSARSGLRRAWRHWCTARGTTRSTLWPPATASLVGPCSQPSTSRSLTEPGQAKASTCTPPCCTPASSVCRTRSAPPQPQPSRSTHRAQHGRRAPPPTVPDRPLTHRTLHRHTADTQQHITIHTLVGSTGIRCAKQLPAALSGGWRLQLGLPPVHHVTNSVGGVC